VLLWPPGHVRVCHALCSVCVCVCVFSPSRHATSWHAPCNGSGLQATSWHAPCNGSGLQATSWHAPCNGSGIQATSWHAPCNGSGLQATSWHDPAVCVVFSFSFLPEHPTAVLHAPCSLSVFVVFRPPGHITACLSQCVRAFLSGLPRHIMACPLQCVFVLPGQQATSWHAVCCLLILYLSCWTALPAAGARLTILHHAEPLSWRLRGSSCRTCLRPPPPSPQPRGPVPHQCATFYQLPPLHPAPHHGVAACPGQVRRPINGHPTALPPPLHTHISCALTL
jgi:hypothetical protein